MSELTIADIHRLIDARVKWWLVSATTASKATEATLPQAQPTRRNWNVEHWHQATDAIHDLIALSLHRHYITQPQVSDLLDLAKQLRALVARYENDEA